MGHAAAKLEELILGIDWQLLQKQKLALLRLSSNDSPEQEHLNGIISLIDGIQDWAVDDAGLPESYVFNEKRT